MTEFYVETKEAGILTFEALDIEIAKRMVKAMGLTILEINEC